MSGEKIFLLGAGVGNNRNEHQSAFTRGGSIFLVEREIRPIACRWRQMGPVVGSGSDRQGRRCRS